ncbi:hypothetical protein SAMN04515647_2208 [Cohaesibacter sp. ES.047]|nr:hypothetical protein SAMN04515647_2208 [Cohaesibacter sp. ES.047]
MSWEAARREADGAKANEEIDFNAEMNKRALRLCKDMSRAVGPRAFQDTDAFALALTMVDQRLPKMLMQSFEWWDPLRETIAELSDDLEDADELTSSWEEKRREAEAEKAAQVALWGS